MPWKDPNSEHAKSVRRATKIQLRQKAAQEGNCVNCLSRKKREGKVCCEICSNAQRECYQRNREKYIALASARTKANKVALRIYCRIRCQKKRRGLIEYLGGRCTRCGFNDFRALQVDHVQGDGFLYKHGRERYDHKDVIEKQIRADVDRKKFQLLCANCNWIKRFEENETILGKAERLKRISAIL